MGYWDFGRRRTESGTTSRTPKDVNLRTNYLLFEYKARVSSRPLQQM
jgi:hypothetical protein